jgi:hypothetical protein
MSNVNLLLGCRCRRPLLQFPPLIAQHGGDQLPGGATVSRHDAGTVIVQ